jgi:N6-adenosine-specific RNA methylase IME4
MANDLVLAELNTARTALAKADTIQKTKNVLDVAVAAETYAKRQKLGEEAINFATSIKVEALRQLGRMLKETPRNTGVRMAGKDIGGTKWEPPMNTPTLEEMGLDKRTSKLAQDIAALPEEQFEAVRGGVMALSKAQKEVSRERNKNKPVAEIPDGKYRVFYADPPWKYTSGDQHSNEAQATTLTTHYNSMSIQELCQLPIKLMAQDDAVLFMWTTSPLLEECFYVINAWGFKYKTSIVWDKMAHNVGHYISVRHEFLLICTRGSCTPDIDKLLPSVVSEKRTEHSVKPETFRNMIDTMYPKGKRIELFARHPAKGWAVWGNDV